jgi:AraC family transcriptional regulator, regulatory protein of adaptative response / methylated-DNA-[protein]-cysteine methyltransferase
MTGIQIDPTDDARWKAVEARDRQAAGQFVYGVITTGIYCRPGCASKQPRREHVRFFETWQEAEAAGFRACKRCAPREATDRSGPHDAAILHACRRIERAEEAPALADLARDAGLSPSHFHRLFKLATGVTPGQYAAAVRARRVRAGLQESQSVTDAIYGAGFGASSRFYERSAETLGMTPSAYRNGGAGQRIRYATAPCYLGRVLAAATERGICAIEFGDGPAELRERLQARFPEAELIGDDPDFAAWIEQVLAFLDAPAAGLHLPLDIAGAAFQRRVWAALQEIPAGATASYREIAARIGNPRAARAVAGACAANRIAVAIPCHRVVRGDGEPGGYRWGVDRKRELLRREKVK